MSTPYTPTRRRTILDAYFAALGRTRGLAGPQTEDIAIISSLWDEYVDETPFINLSRCPYSNAVIQHSFDPYGLDGLWWNYDATARPSDVLPETFFALSGAVRLGPKVDSVPFLCKPGPEAPFVIPRIMARKEITAVVSSFQVGSHMAFPVFYFANPMPFDLERVNTWGTSSYRFLNQGGSISWNTSSWEPTDFDFNLRPWIESGRLQWIAPGDPDMVLHNDLGGCPYLDLPGRQYPLNIENGQVWKGVYWDVAEPSATIPEVEAPKTKFCRNCGKEVKPTAAFCPGCGTKQ